MSPWLLFSRINGYTRETGRGTLRGPRALRGAGGFRIQGGFRTPERINTL